ncbi:MAG: HIT domain-containing protein [Spirochaetales bacterium]|nr:HIT domain-containing protein [Spirochaetales bacterium]
MFRDYFFSFEKFAYVQAHKPAACVLCLIRDYSPEVVDLSVYRDELFIAAINLYPYNPGHLLIFPCRHIVDVRQYTPEEERRLAELTRYLLDISDAVQHPAGFNLGYNMGSPAGASINHLHLHLIPRYPNELGIADLIAGKRVLVEEPREAVRRFRERIAQSPFSSASS